MGSVLLIELSGLLAMRTCIHWLHKLLLWRCSPVSTLMRESWMSCIFSPERTTFVSFRIAIEFSRNGTHIVIIRVYGIS